MSSVDEICEYVLNPEDPETWDGEEGDECYIDEDVLNEDGVWACPHKAVEGETKCIFHLPVGAKDSKEVIDAISEILETPSPCGDSGSNSRCRHFIGTRFGRFDLVEEAIERGPLDVSKDGGVLDFSHATFQGAVNLSGSRFSGPRVRFCGATFEGTTVFSEYSDDVVEFTDAVSFTGATFRETTVFKQVRFRDGAAFEDTRFERKVGFNDVVFGGMATFDGAAFEEKTLFHGTRFDARADFSEAEFCDVVNFAGAHFDAAEFNRAKFRNLVGFRGAEFEDRVPFEGAQFHTNAVFEQARFGSGAVFEEVTFNGEVTFEESMFEDASAFSRAEFGDKAIFSGSEFEGVSFKNAVFEMMVTFDEATVRGTIGFSSVEFEGEAVFESIGFRGTTSFKSATFGGEAKFTEAKFFDHTLFHDADFEKDADFQSVEATKLYSKRTRFLGDVTFSAAEIGVADFRDAEFGEKADFQFVEATKLFSKRTRFLGDVTFSAAEIGAADFRNAEFGEKAEFENATLGLGERAMFRKAAFAGPVTFEGAEISGAKFSNARFDSDVSFRYANLPRANFLYLDMQRADFRKANLEAANFEQTDLLDADLERAKLSNADLFGTDLSGARIYHTRFGGAAIDTETIFDRHGDHRCVYDPRSEYEYETDDGEKVVRLNKAMGAYHTLEQLTRANTLPDAQATFFVRRQDMRRAQLRQDGQRLDYWFAEAQNAVFRHGESFSRVVGWSVGTIVAFAFIFPLGGWLESDSAGKLTYGTIAESPELMWQAFYHSALLFLAGGGPLSPTGFVGEVLTTIEALIAPILLALLIFVLGRRAAR